MCVRAVVVKSGIDIIVSVGIRISVVRVVRVISERRRKERC